MKKIIKILSIIILVLILILIIFVVYIGKTTANNIIGLSKNENNELEIKNYLKEQNINIDEFESAYNLKTGVLISTHNNELPYYYIDRKSDISILLCHGLGGTKETTYPLAKYFSDKGYNVWGIDMRAHGENYGKGTTGGFYEKEDVKKIADYILSKGDKLIIYGESYAGLGTSMAASEYQEKILGLILDCPVSNMESMIKDVLKKYEDETGLPAEFMLYTGNVYLKITKGYSINDMDARKFMKRYKGPLLFFSSKIDDVVPYENSVQLYEVCPSLQKNIYASDISGHIEVFKKEKDIFNSKVNEFINELI